MAKKAKLDLKDLLLRKGEWLAMGMAGFSTLWTALTFLLSGALYDYGEGTIGLAFIVKWAIDRGTGSLYAGAIITALAVPNLLNAAGVEADGLSTFSFGIAFLFIAAVRAVSGGGIGWQLWFGGFLTLLGAVNIAGASFGGYVVPIVLVALGLLLILRGAPGRVR
jgi:hypothetical protein